MFKVGDRVELNEFYFGIPRGKLATVEAVNLSEYDATILKVRFDDSEHGLRGIYEYRFVPQFDDGKDMEFDI